MANLSCLLLLAILIVPVARSHNSSDDSKNVVIASRIAEDVIREVGSRRIGAGEIPPDLLSRYEDLGQGIDGFAADARIVDESPGSRKRVAVSVSWRSADGPKHITIVRPVEFLGPVEQPLSDEEASLTTVVHSP